MKTELSCLESITITLADGSHREIFVKRDDKIDEVISGNKWRKLKYAFEAAKHKGKTGIYTYGGAYSNHLVATAKAAQIHGFKSIGVVRGEELTPESNETLKACSSYGMELHFVSREAYKMRNDYESLQCTKNSYNDYLIIPEGGACYHGVIGCQEILKEIPQVFDHIFVAAGTGTTAAGLLLSCPEKSKLHVVSSLKGKGIISSEIRKRLADFYFDEEEVDEYLSKITVHENYHFGGYGKWDNELRSFMEKIKSNTHLPLDPIYTGKAFYALYDLISKNEIEKDATVLFIHTGGLQGWNGVK